MRVWSVSLQICMNELGLNSRMSDSESDDSTRSQAFIAINGIPIYFNEDWDTGIGGGLWTTGKIPEMM